MICAERCAMFDPCRAGLAIQSANPKTMHGRIPRCAPPGKVRRVIARKAFIPGIWNRDGVAVLDVGLNRRRDGILARKIR